MKRPTKDEYRTARSGLMVIQYDKAINAYIDYLESELKAEQQVKNNGLLADVSNSYLVSLLRKELEFCVEMMIKIDNADDEFKEYMNEADQLRKLIDIFE
ncbi:MAG: hypothetical protein H8D45_33175 [Bacteroidetes bacterium]|nr:hypothetical protein [Bacteroidota bacterium]